MKKIILAVASVLALGLFASCQREISGEIDTHNTDTYTKYYSYDMTGSYTQSYKYVYASKVSGAAEVAGNTVEKVVTYTPKEGNVGATLTITESKQNNRVDYAYALGSFEAISKETTTTPAGLKTVNVWRWDNEDLTIHVSKVDGKYYVKNVNGSYSVLTGFDPYASTIDFSKIVDSTSQAVTSYLVDPDKDYNAWIGNIRNTDTRTYTATGEVDAYTNKTVKTVSGKVFGITLTKK